MYFLQEFTALIAYSIEIIKSISTWINLGQLSIHAFLQFIETITRLIREAPVLLNVVELCFQVIELVAFEFCEYFKIINNCIDISLISN